ncbi:helix-turn-helix domain-containing protein [Deinococcus alpinitundrae]|uniref:helix-turn-helix domain-containing protein n=1 Tax=Deinococcus alpinitundrae TaxID=468913 RepID=UPI00137B647E|nr:helix-turn-helix transcriptional regulator [Deinococcus alpinitundrae]
MAQVRWKLADLLERYGITAYGVAKASEIRRVNTVYRIAKRGEEPIRVDLPTLAALLSGLRALTGEDIQLTDILEYHPDANEEDTEEMSVPSSDLEAQRTVATALERLQDLDFTAKQLAMLINQLQSEVK